MFSYAAPIREIFPELASSALIVQGISPAVDVAPLIAPYLATALDRLGETSEGEFPETQAWRRTFARMGLKPTQYRCASESLLRRFRKDGSLPAFHPLVDLCNALSLASAIPVAVFDLDRVTGALEVRHAGGDERYLTFGGEIENPEPGEVIFADASGQAHARRWTNRQSGLSAIRPETHRVLIVAEALHDTAAEDLALLVINLRTAIAQGWPSAVIQESPSACASSSSLPRN